MISIITPVFNEEDTLEELYNRTEKSCNEVNQNFEMIFVDNGSFDNSLDIIRKISINNKNIKFLSLKKNVGHQGAIWAGLNCTKNTTIIIDADLQQPPELIKEFIKKWREGFKIVNTTKITDQDNRIWKKITSYFFYKIINKFTKLNLSKGQSDFCLLDSKILKEIKKIDEKKSFLRGIVNSNNSKSYSVKYDVQKRRFGDSKFSKFEYFNLAIDGISDYRKVSITILFWLGLLISFSFLIYIIYLLSFYFFYGLESLPTSWSNIFIFIIFLGVLNFTGFYMVGRYILRTRKNGTQRHEYIIKEKNF